MPIKLIPARVLVNNTNLYGAYRACFKDDAMFVANLSGNSVAKIDLSSFQIVATANWSGATDFASLNTCLLSSNLSKVRAFNSDLTELSTIDILGAYTLYPLGNNVLIGSHTGKTVYLYNYSVPSAPVLVDSVTDNSLYGNHDIEVYGNYIFVACLLSNKVVVLNSNLDIVASISIDSAHTLAIRNNVLYVTSYTGNKVYAIDISNIGNMSIIAQRGITYPCDVVIINNTLFVATYGNGVYGLNPSTLAIESCVSYDYRLRRIYTYNSKAYLLAYFGNSVIEASIESAGETQQIRFDLVCISQVKAKVIIKKAKNIAVSIFCKTSCTVAYQKDDTEILAEIGAVQNQPVYRVYMQAVDKVWHDVTKYVADMSTLIWQTQQSYRFNEFLASNCSITFYNKDTLFDTNNPDNFFVFLGHQSSGKNVPVKISGGFVVEGEEVLEELFYGLIVEVDTSFSENEAVIDVSCVSSILRERLCKVGDLVTQVAGGGNAFCYLDGTIYADTLNIKVKNLSDGTFPNGFNPSGYIRIGDEIIYYSAISGQYLLGCIRGVLGTSPNRHNSGLHVFFVLDDGGDTWGKKFQLSFYPVMQIYSIQTEDGDITLLEDEKEFSNIEKNYRKLYAYCEKDKGVIVFGDTPSSVSNVKVKYKAVPRNVTYHGLVKRLLKEEGFSDDLVETVTLREYMGRKVMQDLGVISQAKKDGTLVEITDTRCKACVFCGEDLILGIGGYLVKFTEEAELLTYIPNREIVQLGFRGNSIYGVARTKGLNNLGFIFKWSEQTGYQALTSDIALYTDLRCFYNLDAPSSGSQFKGFSVDSNYVWFLYKDGSNLGVAKVTDNGVVTKYSVPTHFELASSTYKNFDFVDSGSYLEILYLKSNDPKVVRYSRLNKNTGALTLIGDITSTIPNVKAIKSVYISDVTYNPMENRIYFNELYKTDSTYPQGYFKMLQIGTTNKTNIKRYVWKYHTGGSFHGQLSGGHYYNGKVYYVGGDDLSDETYDDGGLLYEVSNGVLNEIAEVGSIYYIGDTLKRVKGISAKITSNSSGDFVLIGCDLNTINSKGHSLIRYSKTLLPIIKVAKIQEKTVWDVLSDLAVLSCYELGVSRQGEVFFRQKANQTSILSNSINQNVTTIAVSSTEGFPDKGVLLIDKEVITYNGKTNTAFLGCQRGQYGSVAVSHVKNACVWNISFVATNTNKYKTLAQIEKNLNYDEIYNYIIVQCEDKKIVFDYKKAGESWETCSEKIYGRRELYISSNYLDNTFLAEAIGFRYYQLYKDLQALVALDIRWNPKISLSDIICVNQKERVVADFMKLRIRRLEYNLRNFFLRLIGITPINLRDEITDYNYE